MFATEQLKEEHKAIKLMLQILEKICSKLESGERVDIGHLEQILDFIRIFADKCHHGKEEDLLFPVLEEAGVPREGGPIGVMLYEHDIGRDFVRKMAQGIERYKEGGEEAEKEIAKNAGSYIQLLRQHIDKEDSILYAMADGYLSQNKQKELLEGFKKIEEGIGKGKHEEFHEVLHHLKDVYLK